METTSGWQGSLADIVLGIDPAGWGCIGFADEAKRNRYPAAQSYCTGGDLRHQRQGSEQMRGKVVGVMEVSHNVGHDSQFIAGDRWPKGNGPCLERQVAICSAPSSRRPILQGPF